METPPSPDPAWLILTTYGAETYAVYYALTTRLLTANEIAEQLLLPIETVVRGWRTLRAAGYLTDTTPTLARAHTHVGAELDQEILPQQNLLLSNRDLSLTDSPEGSIPTEEDSLSPRSISPQQDLYSPTERIPGPVLVPDQSRLGTPATQPNRACEAVGSDQQTPWRHHVEHHPDLDEETWRRYITDPTSATDRHVIARRLCSYVAAVYPLQPSVVVDSGTVERVYTALVLTDAAGEYLHDAASAFDVVAASAATATNVHSIGSWLLKALTNAGERRRAARDRSSRFGRDQAQSRDRVIAPGSPWKSAPHFDLAAMEAARRTAEAQQQQRQRRQQIEQQRLQQRQQQQQGGQS